MKILLIDNYDSFTYNIYQYIAEVCPDILVKRNNEITVAGIRRMAPGKIILSPGPGEPSAAGRMMEVIDAMHTKVPILGICLGHQALALYFGFRITRAREPVHGKAAVVRHDGKGIFTGMPPSIKAGLYNSLIAVPPAGSSPLIVTAVNQAGEVMGIRHETYPLEGVQFHPDSILTPRGKQMLHTWVKMRHAL